MRSLLALCMTLLLALPATPSDAHYRADPSRGRKTVELAVPSSTYADACIVPNHFPSVTYKGRDAEREAALCGYDFYGDPQLAVCPKLFSTNPAVEVHRVPASLTKADFEATECRKARNRAGRKLAKFKQSITCSYAPSILGYYHLSRILRAGRVPTAVVRTMEVGQHRQVVDRGARFAARLYSNPSEIIRQAWAVTFVRRHASPGRHPKLFEADANGGFPAIYGALSVNPRGESRYREVFGRFRYATRYQTFKQQRPYRNLANPQHISQMVGPDLASAAQVVVQMKDVADMIVMDYLMNQQDRMGNIHYKEVWYYLESGELEQTRARRNNATQEAEMAARGAVKVKEMLLKDNDCGVAKSNEAKRHKLVDGIRHLSPRTYHRLLWFTKQLDAQATRDHIRREWLFTEADIASIRENARALAHILEAGCKNGTIHLDLDLEAHLDDRNPPNNDGRCTLPAGLDL